MMKSVPVMVMLGSDMSIVVVGCAEWRVSKTVERQERNRRCGEDALMIASSVLLR